MIRCVTRGIYHNISIYHNLSKKVCNFRSFHTHRVEIRYNIGIKVNIGYETLVSVEKTALNNLKSNDNIVIPKADNCG